MRVAIAGAGLMGKWHGYYAGQCGAQVCGVADPNRPEKEISRSFPGAALFKRVETLLVELKPDVLHVCTPLASHESIVQLALNSGVHILVEKPLAASAESTRWLLAKAAERGILLTPVHQFVFQDGVLRAASALKDIGQPLHFDAVFCSAGGSQMQEEELDELVADILPHPFSLLDHLFPEVHSQIEWQCIRSLSGEWRIVGTAEKMSASILVSLRGRPTEALVRVTGSAGAIHLDLFHGFASIHAGGLSRARKIAHPFAGASNTLWAAGWNLGRRVITREPAYPGLRRLINLFYQAVQNRSGAPLSAKHIISVACSRDMVRNAVLRISRL